MSISWYSYTLLLVSFILCMFLKLLFHRKWLDRFHSRPQTLAYCAWLYASPYDPALPAGGSDENRLIVPNKHKSFLFVSILRYPVLILYPKVLCIFVKTFRFALVLYFRNFVSVYFLVSTPYQYPLDWYIWPPQRQSLRFYSNGMFPAPGQSRSRRPQSYLLLHPLL